MSSPSRGASATVGAARPTRVSERSSPTEPSTTGRAPAVEYSSKALFLGCAVSGSLSIMLAANAAVFATLSAALLSGDNSQAALFGGYTAGGVSAASGAGCTIAGGVAVGLCLKGAGAI